ncbi:MAG: endonuclease [Candidatus Izemoplasmatales bacterium]|nr:endonuclease [Candidatus Izemoplasmatales bacterium]
MKKLVFFGLAAIILFAAVGCDTVTTTTTTTSQSTSDTTTTTTVTISSDTTTTTTTTTSTTTIVTTSNANESLVVSYDGDLVFNRYQPFDTSLITVALHKSSGAVIILDSTAYTLSGYTNSVAGNITVTVSFLGLETTIPVTILDVDTNLDITMTYYLSAQGMTGTVLFDELHDIINTGFAGVDYGTARTALAVTDRDPANTSKLILVYLGTSVSGTWDDGITWNREHVFPQSLLGEAAENSTVNMASDLQNLKPSDPVVNSSRGNKIFNDYTDADCFEPRDEVKGDIARILLYMMTMYSVLEVIDDTTPGVHQMGYLSVLLAWNDLDPVDDFERHRNDVIQSYQHNRNPYIDYPEFVDLIWGN